jgi:chromosome segregation ATPase
MPKPARTALPESSVNGREKFVKQLDDFRAGIDLLNNLMTEMESAHQCAESLLLRELRKKEEILETKDSAVRQLEDTLNAKIQDSGSSLNEREALLKSRDAQLEGLKSELNVLAGRLAEAVSAKERVETSLRDELKRREELINTKDDAIRELKENLSAKTQDLRNHLIEEKQLLKERERQIEELRLEVSALTGRIADIESARERAERLLQDEIKTKVEMLQARDSATSQLKENLTAKVQGLASQLSDHERLLKDRDRSVEELTLEVSALTTRMAQAESAREEAESLLQQEHSKREEILATRDVAVRELENSLSADIQGLTAQIGEKDAILKECSEQLVGLRSEVHTLTRHLSEMTFAKEQAEHLLQDERMTREEMLAARDSAVKERENSLSADIQDLRARLIQKDSLLKEREEELEGLTSEVYALAAQLSEMTSAKERVENLLRDELRTREEALQVREAATRIREVRETLNAQMQNKESLFGEKPPFDPFEILVGKNS